MLRLRARALAVLLGASVGSLVRSASAQEPAPVEPKKGPVPPKVKTSVDPTYPSAKKGSGEKAVVRVELTLDATGKVTSTKVLESGGDAFDAAALEAAPKLEFEPATIDGKPVPAKIAWRFTFEEAAPTVTPPTTVEPTKAAVGTLSGTVLTPADEPLPGAKVVAKNKKDQKSVEATTDAEGRFSFKDLPVGTWSVHVESTGFKAFDVDEEVAGNTLTKVTYRPKLEGDAVEIDVKGERPPREVTKHSLSAAEINKIPGSGGDAIKAIQNLPGVARPPGLAAFLIVRGSAPQETNYFVEGTLVPIIFHFGGLNAVIPTELIERIDFYPGNFGPEFGRVTGGILDVGLRSPKKDGYHGLLQFDLIDGRTLLEGPIDKKTRFAVAARRSWVDVWLGPVLRSLGTGVSTAPVYYDGQAILERDLDEKNTARLAFFGSNDRLAVTLNSPSSSDPALGGDITTTTGFWRLQGRVESRLSAGIRWTNMISYGQDLIEFNLGDFLFKLNSHPLAFRSDFSAKIGKDATVIVGTDVLWSSYDVTVRAPPPPIPGEAPGPFFGRPLREISGSGALYRPAAYAMLDLRPTKRLQFLPGVRLDYTRDTKEWSVNPRVVARFAIANEFPKTVLKAGVGLFAQPPLPQQSIAPFGTTGLQNSRALQYAFGLEQDFTRQINLKTEVFYKDTTRLISQTLSESTTASGVTYGNRGDGRTYGLEVLLRYNPDDKFFGWIAYTLSRAERRNTRDEPLALYAFDQTHILTILGSYKLGKGWQVGARFRYVTGRPYTPNVGGVVDFDAGSYSPVPQFPLNQARLPSFNQLDIRIDKEWKFTSWTLSAYLDVQNVYNRANPEGVSYNFNYTQSNVVSGIPILPSLGLRGEL
ncbi:MAG: TonB-dependent receptor [Myxococcales bacterium]|nr:TonB-dependent receptor [Myxococcales bacterium]